MDFTLFGLSYIISKEKSKYIKIGIITIIAILCVANTGAYYNQAYSEKNKQLDNIIANNIKEDDIIIYQDVILGAIVAEKYPNNKQYFYNSSNWDLKNAYNAFLPQMEIITDLDNIDNYKGRIWLIEPSEDENLYKLIAEDMNIQKIIEKEKIVIPYHNLEFVITLLNK